MAPLDAGTLSFPNALPDGIFSLLDTDLYKLTMQCAILKYLPNVRMYNRWRMVCTARSYSIEVTYAFTNRTPHMRLTRAAFKWLQAQVRSMCAIDNFIATLMTFGLGLNHIYLSNEEFEYLKKTCPYLNDTYLNFFRSFRFQPKNEVRLSFHPLNDTRSDKDQGDLHMDVSGLWLNTILYEIPLLALTSEAYFKFCDTDWNHKDQTEKGYQKGLKLMENGCVFSEFGTRRRRDYDTQDKVLSGLKRSDEESYRRKWTGRFTGTSNVHFAMKYDIPPIGTVAHEWFMGIASITNDYEHANETALRYWVGCFGEGVLGIALTDTFGTPVFLKAFKKTMPTPDEAKTDALATRIPQATGAPVSPADSPTKEGRAPDYVRSKGRSYARIFQGVRQDSGNPLDFVKMMRDFYESEGIQEKKTLVFSDSLNIERCLEYRKAAEEAGFNPTFGVGTFLTSKLLSSHPRELPSSPLSTDMLIQRSFTDDFTSPSTSEKSAPMNIVIKLSSANGTPAIKISDNIGKNTGNAEVVHQVKKTLGYTEKDWAQGDEKTRWGTEKDEESKGMMQEK